jgi:hypothetical protein
MVERHVFRRKRLVGERHIHHGGRMTFGGGQVHQRPSPSTKMRRPLGNTY